MKRNHLAKVALLALATAAGTAVGESLGTDDIAAKRAIMEVEMLGRHLREIDPDWQMKMAVLQPRISEIERTLPPNQWASAVIEAWIALPPVRNSLTTSRPGYERDECNEAAEKANELMDAADGLARCAAKLDFSEDCSRPARYARTAAEDYQSAIQEISRPCN